MSPSVPRAADPRPTAHASDAPPASARDRPRAVAVGLVLLSLAGACGGTLELASTIAAEASIDLDGGELVVQEPGAATEGMRVVIPPATFETPTVIQLRKAPSFADRPLAPAFELLPARQPLPYSAMVTMPIGDVDPVALWHRGPDAETSVVETSLIPVDEGSGRTVTFAIREFGVYQLAGRRPPGAAADPARAP
jgi:hypothetical protein